MQGQSSGARLMHAVPRVKSDTPPTKKQPLTHFLSLPLGHHSGLREKWSRISAELLQASPPIPGLHESIIIRPGSLHLTLGVLSLESREPGLSTHSQLGTLPRRHTIGEALRLLQTLETPIRELLNGNGDLKVALERMDVMRSRPNQKLEQSHVMWAGPDVDNEAGKRLKIVCDLVSSTFRKAGMLQDTRPLKLHCTLINTVYRKEKRAVNSEQGRKNQKRIPFSFSALQSSSVFATRIAVPEGTVTTLPSVRGSGPYKIDLGSWTVDEVQLCEMGSKDADGVYRSVGSIKLHD